MISKLWAVLTVVLAAPLLTEVDGDAGDAAVMVMGLLWADQQCNGFPLACMHLSSWLLQIF